MRLVRNCHFKEECPIVQSNSDVEFIRIVSLCAVLFGEDRYTCLGIRRTSRNDDGLLHFLLLGYCTAAPRHAPIFEELQEYCQRGATAGWELENG